jgi:hypothetical protein
VRIAKDVASEAIPVDPLAESLHGHALLLARGIVCSC